MSKAMIPDNNAFDAVISIYETYRDDEFVSALLTQISWTSHLMIMSKAKTREERDFYVALAAREHYSSRELERQLDSAYYERYMLSAGKQSAETMPQNVRSSILDTYVLEFLDLPEQYSERSFRKAIIENLKQFIWNSAGISPLSAKNTVSRLAVRISSLIFCFITVRCPVSFPSS